MEFPENQFEPIDDVYTEARGGDSGFLYISCGECDDPNIVYQKDGPGPLKRLYVDRIVWPPELVEGLNSASSIDDLDPLECGNGCGNILAVPMIYEPEARFALLVTGAIKKYLNAAGAQSRTGSASD